MVVVTETDEKLWQGIVEITWLYSLECNQSFDVHITEFSCLWKIVLW